MKDKTDSKGLGLGLWLFAITMVLYLGMLGSYSISGLMYVFLVMGNSVHLIFYLTLLATGVFSVFVLFLEFSYKKSFKKISLLYLWASFLILTAILSAMQGSLFICPIFSSFTIIWTAYLSLSKRVKTIFTK